MSHCGLVRIEPIPLAAEGETWDGMGILKASNNYLAVGLSVAAVVMLCLVAVVVLASPFGGGESPTYVISKGWNDKFSVRDSSGVVIGSSYDAQSIIQQHIDKTPYGGVVQLRAGVFTLASEIRMKSGVTLAGVGSSTVLENGGISIVDNSSITIRNLKVQGSSAIILRAVIDDVHDVTLSDIAATNTESSNAVFVIDSTTSQVYGVRVIRCSVDQASEAGFLVKGSGGAVRDVTFDSCKATACGLAASAGTTSGFMVGMGVNLTDLSFHNCEASSCGENGFYIDPKANKTNVALNDAIASNNGASEGSVEGYGYFVDESVMMNNCVGEGNRAGLVNLQQDDPPMPPVPETGTSQMTIGASTAQLETNSNLQLTGSLEGSSSLGTSAIGNAAVSVSITLPDGSIWEGSTSTVSGTGQFSMDYTPTMAGSYSCAANWSGDSSYQGSGASTSFEAVDPVPPVIPGEGATEYTGAVYATFAPWSYSVSAINSALLNCPYGQAVKLLAGTYVFDSQINIPSGKYLVGSTDGYGNIATIVTTNLVQQNLQLHGRFYISGDGSMLRNIESQQGYHVFLYRATNFLVQDVEYHGCDYTRSGQFGLNGVEWYTDAPGAFNGGTFVRVRVYDAPFFGFLTHAEARYKGEYSASGWTWDHCVANGCGIALAQAGYLANNYACGFDFFEGFGTTDPLINIVVKDSTANGNFNDGFHLEWEMDAVSMTWDHCEASNNGVGHNFAGHPYDLQGLGFYNGGHYAQNTVILYCRGSGNHGFMDNPSYTGSNAVQIVCNGNSLPAMLTERNHYFEGFNSADSGPR